MPFHFFIAMLMLCFASTTAIAQSTPKLPRSLKADPSVLTSEPICDPKIAASWREAHVIEGVKIQASNRCSPDKPALVAAVVKGTNNISMGTLMETVLSTDTIIKKDDLDGDGDPDRIIIKLEVMELNGTSPDFEGEIATFDIAPGINPGAWVFAPKTRGMSTENFESNRANSLLRMPSPVIRVEQGDIVQIVLENTHYFPHTIHLHGVDHQFKLRGEHTGSDGVPQTSESFLMPGQQRTYEIQPRQTGTMLYHCHVQTHTHLAMGLVGMFIIEENRPNNWVQTFNVGGGQVRHPSVAILEEFDQEYDLHYHAMDKELHEIIQKYNDPRLVARDMNRLYDITDATEDYYTLNGVSFPYTLRESIVTVKPNQKIKLRVANSASEMLAMHTHGHKATITHYDGVEHNPAAQITRDVYDIAPAQRIDLTLNTTDDGLHSYGEGVWIFHDHREKGITNDGMNPGGNVSAVVYQSYLNELGLPNGMGVDISKYFTKEFHARKLPVWQDLDEESSLGVPDGRSWVDPSSRDAFVNVLVGLFLGIGLYFLMTRLKSVQIFSSAFSRIKKSKGDADHE